MYVFGCDDHNDVFTREDDKDVLIPGEVLRWDYGYQCRTQQKQ